MFLRPASNLLVPFMQPQFRRGRGTAGGGGPTLLIDEGFEGTGTPTGWFSSGASDWDYATSPLAGAQSLRVTAAGSSVAFLTDGGVLNHTEAWGKLLLRIDALPSSFSRLFVIRDSGFSEIFILTINSTGTLTVQDTGGTVFQTTTDAMSVSTLYRVYWHYRKGTGANAVCEGGFATTDARPVAGNKYAGGSNGVPTTNATNFYFAPANSAAFVLDSVQASIAATFN